MDSFAGRRLLIIATISAACLAISGCGGNRPSGEPTPVPSATQSPSAVPTATPEPEPEPVAEPSSWIIESSGVGPLALGAGIAEARSSMTSFTDSTREACPWVAAFEKPGYPSIWLPDPSNTGAVEQIVIQAWGVARDVAANSPRTNAGIGIGATEDELLAAHPDVSAVKGKYDSHYALQGEDGNWVNFGISDAGVVDTIVVRSTSAIDAEYCS